MNRVFGKLVAVAASSLVLGLLASPPASADISSSGAATLEAVDGFVAADACQDGPPAFRLIVDEWTVPDYDDWSADITISGPGGYYETDFLWDDEGWNKVWFCDSPNRAGTYTVTADVEITQYSDFSGYTTSYETVSTTFQVRGPAASTVTYTKRKWGAHGWKFPVKVTRNDQAWANKRVLLQAKVCGGWHRVFAKSTGSTGRVTFTSKPTKRASSTKICGVRGTRIPFRFYVAGNNLTQASHSSTFHIRRR
jgi:hypothetical protein